MSTQDHYAGSCLCGGIQYEVRGSLGDIIQCHCRRCRKATGTAFATNSPIAKSRFSSAARTATAKVIHYHDWREPKFL